MGLIKQYVSFTKRKITLRTTERIAHMETQLLTANDVATHLGVSKSTVWRFVQAGKLAQPIKLSERCSRWKASDLATFIESAEHA